MKNNSSTYIKNILLPCLILSTVTGIFTGAWIFLFKFVSSKIIKLSSKIYSYIRENPKYIIPLILVSFSLGGFVALILKFAPHCKGGGIPTAVTALRGLITFNWIKSVFLLFFSAMFTYLAGVPLGNEGPSVQMGAAIGK